MFDVPILIFSEKMWMEQPSLDKIVARRGSGCLRRLVRQHGPRSKPLDHTQFP